MLSRGIDLALSFSPGRVLLSVGGVIATGIIGCGTIIAAPCSDEAG